MHPMKSTYLFSKNDGYITLAMSGEYHKDDFMTYPDLILAKCEKEHIGKVLVDGSNLSGTNVPVMDRYFIAENLANLLRFKVKVAVVWPKEHITRFAENVAVNRGSSMIVVDSMEAAHKWLTQDV